MAKIDQPTMEETYRHSLFLRRFIIRGWLHGTREDAAEQAAVDFGLKRRWLRQEGSEVHFTPKGRTAIDR